MTEDDLKNLENEMQKITDKFVKEIDKTCRPKTKRSWKSDGAPRTRLDVCRAAAARHSFLQRSQKHYGT